MKAHKFYKIIGIWKIAYNNGDFRKGSQMSPIYNNAIWQGGIIDWGCYSSKKRFKEKSSAYLQNYKY